MTETTLQQLIADAEPETLTLEFKAAASLTKNEQSKNEITKDVCAMANADGGRLIYGIAERHDGKQRGIASCFDPIDSTVITMEWLDQIIGMIRPKIGGVTITPVPILAGLPSVCYVVDIPAGLTAHQAIDRRYYQRTNGRAEPMYDYQIRDVMARGDHPRVLVDIALRQRDGLYLQTASGERSPLAPPTYELWVWLRNDGVRLARFVNGWIEIPTHLVLADAADQHAMARGRVRPFAAAKRFEFQNKGVINGPPNMLTTGAFVPLLPGLSQRVASIQLNGLHFLAGRHEARATWQVHADNAPVQRGEMNLNLDIEPA